jgi:hypothetical protein
MDKYINLAKKLKALADRGIDGEKINAEKMLNDLLKKHKLTIEDVEGEQTFEYYFKIKEKDFDLWYQIVKSTNHEIKTYGSFPESMIRKYKLRGNYSINCSVAEYIEIESKHSILKPLYESEVGIFFGAFCRANNILVMHPSKSRSINDLKDEELENLAREIELSKKIKTGAFRKQIQEAKR